MISAKRKISFSVMLALLALGAASPARADSTPTFFKDPATGCNVGTFVPEPGLSVRWSGPCVNGVAEGSGTVEWQKNGAWRARSTGVFHSGLRDGQFTFTYPDGSTSVAAYHNGLPTPIFHVDPASHCSLGTFSTDTQLSVHWGGACNGGKAEGPGIAEWQQAGKFESRTEGNFHAGMAEGRALRIYADGRRVEGEYHNGQANGRCIILQADGGRFDGQCVNDVTEGHGKESFADGDSYEGDYHSGFNGRGVYIWKSGERYEGDWVNGKRTGRGRDFYTDGGRYEGDWVNDRKQGQGTFYFVDGGVYEGEWSHGLPNGRGVFHGIPNGLFNMSRDFAGTWVNGCFSQPPLSVHLFKSAAACGFRE